VDADRHRVVLVDGLAVHVAAAADTDLAVSSSAANHLSRSALSEIDVARPTCLVTVPPVIPVRH